MMMIIYVKSICCLRATFCTKFEVPFKFNNLGTGTAQRNILSLVLCINYGQQMTCLPEHTIPTSERKSRFKGFKARWWHRRTNNGCPDLWQIVNAADVALRLRVMLEITITNSPLVVSCRFLVGFLPVCHVLLCTSCLCLFPVLFFSCLPVCHKIIYPRAFEALLFLHSSALLSLLSSPVLLHLF